MLPLKSKTSLEEANALEKIFKERYGNKHTRNVFVTPAGCIAAGVGRAFSRVCLSVSLRSKRKTAWAINTELGTCILYSRRSACIDLKVKRSKVKVTRLKNRHGRTVASDTCYYGRVLLLLLPACSEWPCPWFWHPFHLPSCFSEKTNCFY